MADKNAACTVGLEIWDGLEEKQHLGTRGPKRKTTISCILIKTFKNVYGTYNAFVVTPKIASGD